MSWKFYNSVIEEECRSCGIEKQSLKPAVSNITKAHNVTALKTGSTFVDYNVAANRCAYMYKYAALHTALVHKYVLKCLSRRGEAKKLLLSKENITICCLGGGPGTDIIGVLKALAVSPCFRKKIAKVVVLDICRGWCNSFNFITTGLLEGKIKKIPKDFIDESKFVPEFLEVNLLKPLPWNVVEAIATADIVCSVKFASSIFSNPKSARAFKIITDTMKSEAVFLFIDNKTANVYESVETLCEKSGLKIVLGPLHENFLHLPSKEIIEMLEYPPSFATTVSVIGMIKLEKTESISNTSVTNSGPSSIYCNDGSSSSELESEPSRNIFAEPGNIFDAKESSMEASSKVDEFTQTNSYIDIDCVALNFDDDSTRHLENILDSLESDLNCLLVDVDKYIQRKNERKCSCCHCFK